MSDQTPSELRRSLSLTLVTLYGLGTTIGAGIYVLLGKVAAQAGPYTPISFLLACLLAALTAFSFAELSTRFPRSAGEAVYILEGFGSRGLAIATGLLVAAAGVVSCATLVAGYVGYLREFVPADEGLAIGLTLVGLGLVALWGITESVAVAAVGTLVEVVGLLLVIGGGGLHLEDVGARLPMLLPPAEGQVWLGIVAGSVLAFYAFLGFEDMVNIVEETRDPARTMPRAIVATLLVTTVLYVLLSVVAVLAVPPERLAGSEAPLAVLFRETTGVSAHLIAAIAVFSVINGALIQIIKTSRVLYGMARQGWLPARLATVGRRTRTPWVATSTMVSMVGIFALWLPVLQLAQLTSFIVLITFAAVNFGLVRIRRRLGVPAAGFQVPTWVPILGSVACGLLALFQLGAFSIGIH